MFWGIINISPAKHILRLSQTILDWKICGNNVTCCQQFLMLSTVFRHAIWHCNKTKNWEVWLNLVDNGGKVIVGETYVWQRRIWPRPLYFPQTLPLCHSFSPQCSECESASDPNNRSQMLSIQRFLFAKVITSSTQIFETLTLWCIQTEIKVQDKL